MPFKDLLAQAKSRAEGFAKERNIPTHLQQQQHHQQQTYSSPSAPPVPSNRPPNQYTPPVPPNRPSLQPSPYWQPSFSPSTPVSANFKHQLGAHGWGNNELQNYVASGENSFHTGDGKLVIRAIARNGQFTSARLTSHTTLSRQRGSLVAVVTPPSAPAIWGALWLLPSEPFQWPNEGEVDILENWDADGINHSCLHWGQFNGEDWDKHRVCETHMSDMGRRPIQYEFVWEQREDTARNQGGGRAVWYIDGRPVMKGDLPAGARRISDWQVIINVAMGGNVCQGKKPGEGQYDMVVHELRLSDQPLGGWQRFEADYMSTPAGHP